MCPLSGATAVRCCATNVEPCVESIVVAISKTYILAALHVSMHVVKVPLVGLPSKLCTTAHSPVPTLSPVPHPAADVYNFRCEGPAIECHTYNGMFFTAACTVRPATSTGPRLPAGDGVSCVRDRRGPAPLPLRAPAQTAARGDDSSVGHP